MSTSRPVDGEAVHPGGRFIWLGLVGLAIIVALVHSYQLISERSDTKDAAHYVEVGVHLARSGEFGFGPGDPVTMYREPLTSWLIAAQVRSDPRLADLRVGAVDWAAPGVARAIRQQNLFWSLMLLVSIALLARRLVDGSGSRGALVPAASVLLVHAAFIAWEDVIDRSLNELPAAALVSTAGLVGLLVVDAARRGASRRSVMGLAMALGLLLGLLALTKSVFLYVAPVHVLVLLGLLIWDRRPSERGPSGSRRPRAVRTVLAAGTATILTFTAVVSPWLVRNERQFGEIAVASRGGLGLWSRALKNGMTDQELRAAWVVFSPGPLRLPMAELLDLDVDDTSPQSPFRRVDRYAFFYPHPDDELDTFYRLGRRDRARMTADFRRDDGLAWSPASVRADAVLRGWGLERLMDEPLAWFRTAPAFLWRGTWPMLSSPLLPTALLGPLNPLGMGLLLAAAVAAVLQRRVRMAAVTLLPAGMVAFYALLTHHEARFSRPAVPVMLLLVVMSVVRISDVIRGRRGRTA